MEIYSQIKGLGFYVPERIIENSYFESYLDTTDKWIVEKIGVKERRVASSQQVTSDLAAEACVSALTKASVHALDIDCIIFSTNTPDNLSPQTSVKIQEKIGAKNAFAFDLRVGGCPGLVYAISIADQFIKSGKCKNVLAVSAEINSRGIDWQDRSTAVILGDGASAVVLTATTDTDCRIIDTQLFTDPKGYYDAYIPAGGTAEPFSESTFQDRRHYFKMNGREIYKFAVDVFPASVSKIVKDNGFSIQDIDFIISHQANINIIKESMYKLGISMTKTYTNLKKYGNTSGASVGIAFAEAVDKGYISRGDLLILVAYGAGSGWGTILIKY